MTDLRRPTDTNRELATLICDAVVAASARAADPDVAELEPDARIIETAAAFLEVLEAPATGGWTLRRIGPADGAIRPLRPRPNHLAGLEGPFVPMPGSPQP